MTRTLFRSSSAPSTTLSSGGTSLRCPSCSTQNSRDALQCAFCGSWLVSTALCHRCEGLFYTRAEHCSSCGASLDEAQPLSLGAPPAPRRRWTRRRTIVAVAAVGLVVSLLVVGLTIGHLRIWDSQGGLLGPLILLLALVGGVVYVTWDLTAGVNQALPAGSWGDRSAPITASSSGRGTVDDERSAR